MEEVAAKAAELTDIAREALRAELAKPGLYVGQLDQPPESDAAEFRGLVEVRRYWNLLEGELARGPLEAAGIEAFLFDDNMRRMDWFNANAIGGVKLRVDASNVQEAKRILEEEEVASANAEPDQIESDRAGEGGDSSN